MKVGLVITEVSRAVGGRFTFQEMLVAAVDRLREETSHEFVTYVAGISRFTEGSPLWRARRLSSVGVTLTVQAARDLQQALLTKRVWKPRTPLEQRVAADGVDLVWFPTTYIEDVNVPFICTVFDVEHRMKPWFPEVSADGEFERRERMCRRYYPKATRIIVPSEVGRDQLAYFYSVPPENCLTLTHPTPDFVLEAARQLTDATEMRPTGEPFLLYPAQFWPHKNHAAALDVISELRARGEEMCLVLVGQDVGFLDHVRRQVRERGLERAVRVLGTVTEEELIGLYRTAHALLYLSRFGPENLPPLEAFALGCPAIVADVPGAREQLGSVALIVDPTKPEEIADVVQRLKDPDERDHFARVGRERANAWTADDYVRGVLGFLDEFERERRLWA